MSDVITSHFKNIADSTDEDWQRIYDSYIPVVQSLPERIKTMLLGLGHIQGALPISRLDHSLQAATRALKDNRDDQYIFTALLHDIGSFSSIYSHAQVSAAILKDHISEELCWMVAHHEFFQNHYIYKQLGETESRREKYLGHPNYELTKEFCFLYDAPSWDKSYRHLDLVDFEDLLRQQLNLKSKHGR